MNKILLGILIGFFLHKGFKAYYNYSWWTSEFNCRGDVRNKENPFVCIYEDMGIKKYLFYLILSPSYDFQEWGLKD